ARRPEARFAIHRVIDDGEDLRTEGGDDPDSNDLVDGARIVFRAVARLFAHSVRRGARRIFFQRLWPAAPETQLPLHLASGDRGHFDTLRLLLTGNGD